MKGSFFGGIAGFVAGLSILVTTPCRASDTNWDRIGKVNRAVVTTVTVTNVMVSARDSRTAFVTFDIAWENSWRTNVNHDAAWVFFKVLPKGTNAWQHVMLDGSGVNPRATRPAAGTENRTHGAARPHGPVRSPLPRRAPALFRWFQNVKKRCGTCLPTVWSMPTPCA